MNAVSAPPPEPPASSEAAVPGAHSSALFVPRQRAIMLFVLFLISTTSYLDRMILAVALEPIKREFHASDTMLGALSGLAFALFYGTLGIPIARWADRGDRRAIITAALALWSFMTLLCGLAGRMWQLVLARIGVGAGESGAMAPAQSLIGDYFPPAQRGRAIGLFMLSLTAGNFLGLAGGGWLTQHHGWRAMFLAAGIPGLLLAPLAYGVLREPRAIGQGASAPVSVSAAPQAGFGQTLRLLWDKPSYVLTTAALILFFMVSFGPLAFVVPFLIRVHHLSVGEAGGLFGLITAAAGLIGNVGSGILSDRLVARDQRWALRLPAIALVSLYVCYLAAFLTNSLAIATAALFVGGLLFAGSYPPIYASLHTVCGSARRTTAFALALSAANLFGLCLGPVGVGLVSDHLAVAYGSADGLRYALAILIGLCLPTGLLLARAARHIGDDAEP